MTTYETGRVYSGVVDGAAEPVLLMRVRQSMYPWRSASGAYGATDVTDVRGPLPVLDPLGAGIDEPSLAGWVRSAGEGSHGVRADALIWLADQIEAQTKPPRPDEPTGLGAVVTDGNGMRWVRVPGVRFSECAWRSERDHWRSHWSDIKDPVVKSAGCPQ